jgi:hypothetical protein
VETGSTATAYQKVTTQYDVTEAGVSSLSYLAFDGVDDFLVTPTITPGIDKAQVFAGVRKLSDAAVGMVVEHSANSGSNNGTFQLAAPDANGTTNYRAYLRGDAASTGFTMDGFVAPVTNVISVRYDLAGADRATEVFPRVNGSIPTLTSAGSGAAGTGNFLAYPIYIGRRAGTSLPLNGQIYSLIVRFGANLTADQITSTETWVNGKTRAY